GGDNRAGNRVTGGEPVIGVEEPAPAHRASASAVRPGLHVEHVAQPPSDLGPRKEIDIVRARWIFRLHDAGGYVADVVWAHKCHRLRSQQLRALEAAPVQQHLQKREVVRTRRIERATTRPEFGGGRRLQWLWHESAVSLAL